ncbi:unnamed protein product [Paramecium pentaurelia]|uniref:Uncharacterized protein n=1 Tax=Paramecium pentaurelia TaxID=43138 RepID=A0A8S1TT25_9CILI|nr:unnamed protein product [Paramecium pentaurelia]
MFLQFQYVKEYKLKEANFQVYLYHPSKISICLKKLYINVSNLGYLIIEKADQLLDKNEQNQSRIDTTKLISFILGQTNNQSQLIILVSTSFNSIVNSMKTKL